MSLDLINDKRFFIGETIADPNANTLHIFLDYIDRGGILTRNACIRAVCLRDWCEATILINDHVLDRVKTQGTFFFAYPNVGKGEKVDVITCPETEWSLILAIENTGEPIIK